MENPFLYLISIFIGTLLGVSLGHWISGNKKISFRLELSLAIKGFIKCIAGLATIFVIKAFFTNEGNWIYFTGLVATFYLFYSGAFNFVCGFLIFSKKLNKKQ